MRPRTYLLTGGGTGGHVTPGVAVAGELSRRDPDARIVWIGTRTGKEAEIVPRYGFELAFVPARQYVFRRPWHAIRFAVTLGVGVLKSMWLLLRIRPDIVIGMGGYVAAPTVFANLALRRLRLSNAPTVIHEQNTAPGRLNAAVGDLADVVLVSFPCAERGFSRTAYVGYPVRPEIRPLDRAEARDRLGIQRDARLVFAVGGSMGARTINRAMIAALPALHRAGNVRVVHGTGRKLTAYDPVSDCRERLAETGLTEADLDGWYEPHEFIDGMADYYAAADLVVARAGAGTVAELCASGRPSLLIPKSNLSGDHQVMNALELVHAGAADVVYEDTRTVDGATEEFVGGDELASRILALLDDTDRISRMAAAAAALATPDAVAVTADIAERMAAGDGSTDIADLGLAERETRTNRYAEFACRSGEGLRARADRLVQEAEQRLTAPTGDVRAREAELAELLGADDVVKYLRYRAVGMLASDAWRVRNAGVKLAGILRLHERLPLLLQMLTDRTPTSWLKRKLGADFVQNGFIRRNITDSIATIGKFDENVRAALIAALADPYFEVRSHAARSCLKLCDLIGGDIEIEERLVENSRDRSFEVVLESASALGGCAASAAAVECLYELLSHDSWRIREAALGALELVYTRDPALVEIDSLREHLREVMIVSTGFAPTFALKQTVGRLGARVEAGRTRGGEGL